MGAPPKLVTTIKRPPKLTRRILELSCDQLTKGEVPWDASPSREGTAGKRYIKVQTNHQISVKMMEMTIRNLHSE